MSEVLVHPPFPAYQGDEPYVFVSYSHQDGVQVFADIKRLHEFGYRIWYDEGIDPGNEWPEEIAAALNGAACFLVFISPRAVCSPNVRNEINFALANRKTFLAIHIEETELPSGLALQMGSIQAILKYVISPDRYFGKLDATLSKSLSPGGAASIPNSEAKPERPTRENRILNWIVGSLVGATMIGTIAVGIVVFFRSSNDRFVGGRDMEDVPTGATLVAPDRVAIGPVLLEVNSCELVDSFAAGGIDLDAGSEGNIVVIDLTLTQIRDYTASELEAIGRSSFGEDALNARRLFDTKLILTSGQFLLGQVDQVGAESQLLVSVCRAMRVADGASVSRTHQPTNATEPRIDYHGTHDDRTKISVAFSVKTPASPLLLFFSGTLGFEEITPAILFISASGELASVSYELSSIVAKIKEGAIPILTDPPINGHPKFGFPVPLGKHAYEVEIDIRDFLIGTEGRSTLLNDEMERNAHQIIADASRFDLSKENHIEAFASHVAQVLELPPNTNAGLRVWDSTGVGLLSGAIEFQSPGKIDFSWHRPTQDEMGAPRWFRDPLPSAFREWTHSDGERRVAKVANIKSPLGESADKLVVIFENEEGNEYELPFFELSVSSQRDIRKLEVECQKYEELSLVLKRAEREPSNVELKKFIGGIGSSYLEADGIFQGDSEKAISEGQGG